MEDSKVIYLSPSAQEWNMGVGDFGSEEYRMNRIVDIMVPLLQDRGYIVYRNNPDDALRDIVTQSNEINPDIHVSIHSNASGSSGMGKGPEIYTNRAGTRADILAHDIYDEIIQIYPEPELGRGVLYTDSLYEIIRTVSPAVLLEIAFHDNLEDAEWMINHEQEIAEAIVKGIDRYFYEK